MKPRVLGKMMELVLTEGQRDKLYEYATSTETGGGYQSLCGAVADSAKLRGGRLMASVKAADMDRIRTAAARLRAWE